ncbi:hypothetical protein HPP92_011855 [Vanilla planifolia]|uniref:Ferrochelatase n=1 Tax=Vanilla planifolia TaxID=51239 RepID=A0A835R1F0_VANPL|nr:hypothetical protein HPP92_012200 [Vanilla planifolia]KAG0483771.1 hypothetical protein HPP92_011855 [Vanilla planifolia]
MEVMNSSLQQLKLSGIHQQKFRKCGKLPCQQVNACLSNRFRASPFLKEGSQRDLSANIASDRNGHMVKPLKQLLGMKRKYPEKMYCSIEASTYSENFQGISVNTAEEKLGVLLLNLGGPETLDDVQPFLFNLFADPDIIRLPRLFRFLQKPLAQLISAFRAPKSKEAYASIGGGSPLRKITDEQAHALEKAIERKGLSANVYVAMRYWHPFTEEAIHQIKSDDITKLVVLPLYPQFSISTSGSSIRVLQNIFREDPYFTRVAISIIESWYHREGYIRSMADLIETELESFDNPEEVMIFFSAHGVPLSYVEEAGDPYRDQMEECIILIMDELKSRGVLNNHTLAYQSRVGPVQWLKPYTDEVIVELGRTGVKSLLTVPISFVSEHIETLEEIDMEYKHLALESGILNWGRVPALGCTSSFISDLADAVIEAIPPASAISIAGTNSNLDDKYPLKYIINLFFGSILTFFMVFSPRLASFFRSGLF